MPSGCRGVIETLMVSTTRSSLLSLTPTAYTLLVLAAATKMRAAQRGSPSAVFSLCAPARHTMSVGCAPIAHACQLAAAGSVVVTQRAIGPVGDEERFAVGMEQDAIRPPPGPYALDHHARLRIDHRDGIAVQLRRVEQVAIGRKRSRRRRNPRPCGRSASSLKVRPAVSLPSAKVNSKTAPRAPPPT